jgi:hypothetical protein
MLFAMIVLGDDRLIERGDLAGGLNRAGEPPMPQFGPDSPAAAAPHMSIKSDKWIRRMAEQTE